MDNFDIKTYFQLNDDDKKDVILKVAEEFYLAYVDTTDDVLFMMTVNYSLEKIVDEWRQALREENYELADILYKVGKIFLNLKKQ